MIDSAILHSLLNGLRLACCGLLLVGFATEQVQGAGLEGDKAVEAGKDAFASQNDYPWYDSSTDGVDPLKLRPPQTQTQTTTPTSSPSMDLSWLYQSLQVLAWIAFAAVIVLIVYMMLKADVNQLSNLAVEEDSKSDGPIDPDRVEELPFKLAVPQSDFFSMAEKLYQDGDYNTAIVYLYSYELLQLDKAQVIHLTRGKTNRQYLRETRRGSAAGPILERTIIAFEEVFFGHHELSRERFEVCWNEVEHFKSLIRQSPVEARMALA